MCFFCLFFSHVKQPTAEQIRIAQITEISSGSDDPKMREKVANLMEMTQRTEEEVCCALYECDNDMERAVEFLLETLPVVSISPRNEPTINAININSSRWCCHFFLFGATINCSFQGAFETSSKKKKNRLAGSGDAAATDGEWIENNNSGNSGQNNNSNNNADYRMYKHVNE